MSEMSETTMSSDTQAVAALQARVSELEHENERLTTTGMRGDADPTAAPRRRGRWRPFVSALCIVIAALLVPVSIIGAWVRVELVDPDRFVATLGPVIEDPAVQALIVDRTVSAIEQDLNIEGVTNDLFDGIENLGLPPAAASALNLLRGPAASGVEGLIDQTVARLVSSEAFADIWDRALRATHGAVVAAAGGGGPGGAVTIDESGAIGIQLGPIVAEVKQRLLDRGVSIAEAIPEVDRTIVVAQVDQLATLRVVYGVAVTIGTWLPVIALALFIGGILIARRRSTALLGAGVGLALGSGVLVAVLGAGPTVLGAAAADLQLPIDAVDAIYQQVIGSMRQTAIVGVVLGIVLAVLAWSQGRWRGAVAVRRGSIAVNDAIRDALAARGVDTGSFGRWMDHQRVLVRAVICVLAVVWLWMLRPLTAGEIIGVVAVAVLVWWLAELLRMPAAIVDESADPLVPPPAAPVV